MFFVLFQVTAMPSSRLRSEALPAIEAYSLLTRLRRLGYQAALVVATKQQAAKYVRPVTFREWLSQCEKAIKPRNLKLNLGFVASS